MQGKPQWKWYQEQVARLLSRLPGTTVEENVEEIGSASGVARQIDVRIVLPLRLRVKDFKIEIPIKIIADCKHYAKTLDVKVIEEIGGMKDDVRAQLAIVVSPHGVSKGAKARAEALGVYPITVTGDMFVLLDSLTGDVKCLVCDRYHEVSWRMDAIEGYCDYCSSLHIRCRDCGAIFAIPDPEGTPIECPECDAVYVATFNPKEGDTEVKVYDMLDVLVLRGLYKKSNKSLTQREVQRLVESTRWQHWDVDSPLINLTEEGLVEWIDGPRLRITEFGIAAIDDHISQAESPLWY